MPYKLTFKKRMLFAAVTIGGFFVLLEAVLAVVGIAPITDSSDPFIGFSSQVPLFVEDKTGEPEAGQTVLRTAEHRLVWFNDQRFTAKKQKGTLRVFCLGGSTTYGRPYDDRVSFVGWLRTLLPVVSPEQNVEVINAGGVSYASYRVANILDELTQYEPDLFVVYSAQNEFLERRTYADMFEQVHSTRLRGVLAKTRCWALVDQVVNRLGVAERSTESAAEVMPAEVDEMLNHTVGPADYHLDSAWQERVVQHYDFNLRRMVTLARQAGAEVVFVTPGSNLRDCSPFKSAHSATLTPERQIAFDELVSTARSAIEREDFEAAVSNLEQAERISPGFAQVNFDKGTALFALQQYERALAAFEEALAHDICPLRAIPSIVDTMRRAAAETDSPIVDYETQLRDRCRAQFGHACIGREHFLDHVHPSLDEHREIALALIDSLDDIGFVRRTRPIDDGALDRISADLMATIDPYEEGVAFRNLAKVYHWAGKFAEALPMARRALTRIDEDAPSLFIAGECERLIGDSDRAIEYFDRLLVVEPFHFDGHVSLGMLLSDQQQYEVAALHLAFGISGIPDAWYAHQEYGVVLYQLNEFERAYEELEHANELDPANLRTLYFLSKTAQQIGDLEAAIDLQLEVLGIQGPSFDGHFELADLFRAAGRPDEADKHAAAAARDLAPTPDERPAPPLDRPASEPPDPPDSKP